MHNLTKIKIFRVLLRITYPFALVFLYPFAVLKKRNPSGLFFFLDRYSIGGAQRIHIDILHATEEQYKKVYFTRFSPNDKMKAAFEGIPNTDVSDIHTWCDNLLFRLFSVHFYAFYLNRHKSIKVLGSNSTFFYDVLPFLASHVHKIELLHNFTFGKRGMEFFGLANHPYLDTRIVYDSFTLSNIKKQYAEFKIDPLYLDKIAFIEPGVDIPARLTKEYSSPVKVLYAGRGGPQKRIHLINKIAQRCTSGNLPVEFHFAGTMTAELSDTVKENAIIHGEVSNKADMDNLYQSAHIILLTSAYEGFPMVIKEGMAFGCVPVVTALPGNLMHLQTGQNALLIEAIEDEEEVVRSGTALIGKLAGDPVLLQKLSAQAYEYASQKFTKSIFIKEYRKLLAGLGQG